METTLIVHFLANDCFLKDVEYGGENINACNDVTQSPEECQDLCQLMNDCKVFTWINDEYSGYREEQKQCCLKGYAINSNINEKVVVSGPKHCFGIHMDIIIYKCDNYIISILESSNIYLPICFCRFTRGKLY